MRSIPKLSFAKFAGVALAASLLVAACGTAASAPTKASTAASGGTVKWAEPPASAPTYIFPVNPSADQTLYNLSSFINLMWQPLWSPNETQPTIDYAESIGNKPVWSDNNTVVSVTLKHYLWSNGTPVTTRDLEFYINLAKGAGTQWGNYVPGNFPYNVKSISIQSPYQMTFTLTQSYNQTYYLDGQLAELVPIPQAVWDRTSLTGAVGNYDETPAGATAVWNFLNTYAQTTSTYTASNPIWGVIDGPYQLQSFGGASSPDIFVPNPKFSGHKSTISKFEEMPFTTDTAEYNELRSGSGSISVGYVPAQDAPTLRTVKSEGYNIQSVGDWGVDYMIPNLANPTLGPAFKQSYVRGVLERLTDQATMIKSFLHGYGVATYGPAPIYPKGNPFADSFELKNPYPYSIATAKSVLAAHGWKIKGGVQTCESSTKCGSGVTVGTKLNISLLYTSGLQTLTEQDELLKSDAAKAGIQITLKQEPFNTVVGIVTTCTPGTGGITKTSPQCTWQLGEYGGISYGLYPSGGSLFLPGGALNAGSFNNAQVNKLIVAVRHSSSSAAYHNYENALTKLIPWVWQPSASGIAALAKNLHGPGLTQTLSGTWGTVEPNYWYFSKS